MYYNCRKLPIIGLEVSTRSTVCESKTKRGPVLPRTLWSLLVLWGRRQPQLLYFLHPPHCLSKKVQLVRFAAWWVSPLSWIFHSNTWIFVIHRSSSLDMPDTSQHAREKTRLCWVWSRYIFFCQTWIRGAINLIHRQIWYFFPKNIYF